MSSNHSYRSICSTTIGIIFFLGMMPLVFADVTINVMAVNGAPTKKDTTVTFNLPGELTAQDVLDTNGLQLDYDVNNANYYVHGDVSLEPKESKTFKIHVKDVWKVTPDQVSDIKKEIDQGFDGLGKVHDAQKADLLKTQLNTKLDYIIEQQNSKADSVERRIDSYRTYAKEVKRIENDALSVDYWRSEPGQEEQKKIVHMVMEVSNPAQTPATKKVTEKEYLPSEVKPEHVVEAEGFEVRYDQAKQLSFLFKEEELAAGEKKKYNIGILDIWSIEQADITYLRTRADYAYDFLKSSQYADSAKILYDRLGGYLKDIEDSQAQTLPILEHISAYRNNKETYEKAKQDVETLEKLLSVYRENLEKSKVKNVLSQIKSVKGIGDVSQTIFNKKFESNKAWSLIVWVLVFVIALTLIIFVISLVRSKDKKIKEDLPKSEDKK